ncbi:extracellular solute-binding protein [Streptomyces cocklensis]|uniref:Carbohydrate ABC transporter substrate-binding protein, CUT1 family n=1 Tax=Actinacidiphila cocklensis TaxID=887465 RepID=A0A9W4DYS7_9ACTN|nr:extracellular solute-binding protein [Actinacidiphila cocklensis]MDD1057650.1 extracellular solute-binding protein [Actinacidiphila cocklensis]CAG6398349.1 Carbohydrate ABC transporter substrate-binding protein, CUT1 family [Actinacidiphila cocklensis]
MKRFATLRSAATVAAVTALALTATACGSSSSGAPGSGKVTLWTLQNDGVNPLQKVSIASYNTAHKASVTMKTFVNDPYKQKLQSGLSGADAPDVFLNWGGGNLAGYVKAGDVADLSGRLDDSFKKEFLPSVLDGGTIGGKVYGVPMEGVQPVALFYNKTVFAQAGIKEPPATWAQLLTDVDKLKAKHITPIALAGSQSWTELMWMEYLLDRVGGPEVFKAIEEGKPGAWEDPAVTTALSMIRDLVDRGAFGKKYSTVGQDSGGTYTLLSSGKAGMHLMGSWAYADMLTTAPSFVKGGHMGWAPFPTVPHGKGDPKDVVGNPCNYFSVTEKSDNKSGAVDFIENTVAQPSYIADLLSIGHVPAIAGIKGQLMGGINPDYTVFIYGLVEDAPTFTQSWDQALPPATSATMLTDLQKVFNKLMTPKQFVQAMAS